MAKGGGGDDVFESSSSPSNNDRIDPPSAFHVRYALNFTRHTRNRMLDVDVVITAPSATSAERPGSTDCIFPSGLV